MMWLLALSRIPMVDGERDLAVAAASELPMDGDAFAGLYERSARSLWAYLARASGDGALADDLTQEAFVRFLSADRPASLADGEIACRKYLFRIATNLLKDHWRRPRVASIQDMPEEVFAEEERTGQSDSEAMLGKAMAEMRPRDRQILWLAYAEDYTHKEIAEITGLASTSIRLMLFRARGRMAELLQRGAAR